MTEDWRDFEKLVGRIKRVLAPTGAVVTWNERIADKITGNKRQVDVTIRYTIDGKPILITVECRKRKDKSDVTWIEQLVTKKEDLGAAKTIAVASRDITKPAKKKALHYGIEVRRLSQISQSDMLGWLKIKTVNHLVYHQEIKEVGDLRMYCAEAEGKLAPEVIRMLTTDSNSKVFIRNADGKHFGVNEIIDAAIRKGLDIRSTVPLNGSKIRKNAVINFPKKMFSLQTEKGPRDLARFTLGIDVHATVEVTPLSDMGFSYTGDDIKTVFGVEAETALLGKSVYVSLQQQQGSNKLNVQIIQDSDKTKKKDKTID